MPHYTVNATKLVAAYTTVEADNEAGALEEAKQLSPSYWDTDEGTAEIEFDVSPAVELEA